jgi:hypothetical protein
MTSGVLLTGIALAFATKKNVNSIEHVSIFKNEQKLLLMEEVVFDNPNLLKD